ncbi:hypothetical protein CRG98_006036 [Punica granatum]|uniref:Uncharacterized protein n=1 Tax=Punica granatum TaxID=22663 RepID=A0A2I0KYN0_PUNGR|nr:hypothetical protein CRG98_006036 [Punica granatum]
MHSHPPSAFSGSSWETQKEREEFPLSWGTPQPTAPQLPQLHRLLFSLTLPLNPRTPSLTPYISLSSPSGSKNSGPHLPRLRQVNLGWRRSEPLAATPRDPLVAWNRCTAPLPRAQQPNPAQLSYRMIFFQSGLSQPDRITNSPNST